MNTATRTLHEEHLLICRALDLLEAAAERVERSRPVPAGWWAGVIAWFRTFADRNHHAKEEHALFPAMVKAGLSAEGGGPIAVMLEEHDEGRALLQTMADGEPRSRAAAARRYIDLLRAHIAKEDDILFQLADTVLDEGAQEALAHEFDALTAAMGPDASSGCAAVVLRGLALSLAGSADLADAR
jgi:hemerythrin-like domain-containing protein